VCCRNVFDGVCSRDILGKAQRGGTLESGKRYRKYRFKENSETFAAVLQKK
jgi:hypothetical protein